MYRKMMILLGVMAALGLAACQSAPGVELVVTPVATAVATPVSEPAASRPSRPITLNTPVPSSADAATPTAPAPTAAVAGATPITTTQAVAGATVAPSPATATAQATSSPAPGSSAPMTATVRAPALGRAAAVKAEGSAELKELTIQLEDRVDNLRQALREKDVDTALRLQRDLLAMLSQAEGTIQGEKSELADRLRRVHQVLRQGLTGDLMRIDEAAGILRQLTGQTGTGRLITDLYRYSGELAGKIAAFKKARQGGDIGAVFRTQNELLDEVARARAELKAGRTKLTDVVLAALADLQAGLEGNLGRLDAAEVTLTETAKIPTQKPPTPVPSPTASPRPVGSRQ